MATIKIPYFTSKPLANGTWAFYWEPSPALRRAKWARLALGNDLSKAIAACEKRNEEVAAWRAGGAAPKQVEKFTAPATMADLLRRYRAEELPKKAKDTQTTYRAALAKIERWTDDGKTPLAAIDRKRVAALRQGLMQPDSNGHVRLHTAHGTLRVLRTLMQFAVDEQMIAENPATRFNLETPPSRDQVWEEHEQAFFCATAEDLGYPGMAFAFDLACYTGQRLSDVIAFTGSNWQVFKRLDPRSHELLQGDDGRVMGLMLRQKKTGEPVGIPFDPAMRARVEEAFADNQARMERDTPGAEILAAAVPLLINDSTGQKWGKRRFQSVFAQIMQAAIDRAESAGNAQLAQSLQGMQFRDMRRTCIVHLSRLNLNDAQISAISGHRLATIKKILETYSPRDSDMAASAVTARLADIEDARRQREAKKEKMG